MKKEEIEDQLDHLLDVIKYHENNIDYHSDMVKQHKDLLERAKEIKKQLVKDLERIK